MRSEWGAETKRGLVAAFVLAGTAMLAGCVEAVPEPSEVSANCLHEMQPIQPEDADRGIFVATSRLPDCRTAPPQLSVWRSAETGFALAVPPARPGSHALHLADGADWKAALKRRLDRGDGRVLVFVHGYNNSPAEVVERTAEMVRKTRFQGPAIVFTWPSQAQASRYTWDEQNVAWTQPQLERLLRTIPSLRSDARIILVSHSMGNRATTQAVLDLSRDDPLAAAGISTLVLASPDIDREMLGASMPAIATARRRVVVYASYRDRALQSSWSIHGAPRAGDPSCAYDLARKIGSGKDRSCYLAKPGTVTLVDTSAVQGRQLGHADFVESRAAAADLCRVISDRAEPYPGREDESPKGSRIFHLSDEATQADGCGPPPDQRRLRPATGDS